ncbi:ABC transporter permease [Ferrimicrobium sp.]|uniref:ABC transporter permease n=1 Tax=Ferrimicrobium sp. TaxID=2926050 RepID=UPI00260216C1|nr:ABC transporter permease [Ferrimicrobium sp.]
MTRFVIRRCAQAVVVVFLVTIVVFILQHLEPGSEARAVLGAHASQPQIIAFDQANGLNHALPLQYLTYLNHLIHGNLGYSYQLNESVRSLIAQDVVNDLIIVGIGIVLALVVAIPVGLLQAVRRNRAIDHVATAVMFVFYSTPSFLLGLLLVAIFAVEFRVFPSQVPGNVTGLALLGQPAQLVLPVLTVALVTMALFSRYMRSSGIDKLTQDYIRTARGKGVSGGRVIRKHVLRNASLPLVTLLGLSLPTLFTAGLVAEQIFNVQGVGLAFYNAVVQQDYPVELGITLLVALATVIGNLAADLAYVSLDPTVRTRS